MIYLLTALGVLALVACMRLEEWLRSRKAGAR